MIVFLSHAMLLRARNLQSIINADDYPSSSPSSSHVQLRELAKNSQQKNSHKKWQLREAAAILLIMFTLWWLLLTNELTLWSFPFAVQCSAPPQQLNLHSTTIIGHFSLPNIYDCKAAAAANCLRCSHTWLHSYIFPYFIHSFVCFRGVVWAATNWERNFQKKGRKSSLN